MKNAALSGKPYAGNPHVRFDEGEVASAKPRRGSLHYKKTAMIGLVGGLGFALVVGASETSESDEFLFMNEDAWHFWIADSGDAANMKRDLATPMKPGFASLFAAALPAGASPRVKV